MLQMKVIDEKGRIFGLVNLVDLLVLLIVILIAAAVCWKLFAPAVTDAVAKQVTMTTQLRIRGASQAMKSAIEGKSNPVGKQLVAGNDYVPGTNVLSVKVEPYVLQVTTADGRVVNAVDSSKCDIIVIVQSSVAEGTAVPKISNQEVRIGRTMTFKTNDFEAYANIESVNFES